MRQVAISLATMGFFAAAILGWVAGVPADVCAYRSLAVAAGMYVLVTVAGRLVVSIMADAIVKSHFVNRPNNAKREHGQ